MFSVECFSAALTVTAGKFRDYGMFPDFHHYQCLMLYPVTGLTVFMIGFYETGSTDVSHRSAGVDFSWKMFRLLVNDC